MNKKDKKEKKDKSHSDIRLKLFEKIIWQLRNLVKEHMELFIKL